MPAARRLSLAAAIILILTPSAYAREQNVGKTKLQFPAPSGYCDLDAATAPDGNLLNAIGRILAGAGNTLIAMSVDCKQRTDWRRGSRRLIDHYVQYQARTSLIDQPIPGRASAIQQTCAEARAQCKQFFDVHGPDIAKRIEEVLPRVKVNETSFLGVLHEDASACYAGLIQSARTETGETKIQIAVFATTVAKGQLIYIMRYAPYAKGIIDGMLAEHRRSVDAFLVANPD